MALSTYMAKILAQQADNELFNSLTYTLYTSYFKSQKLSGLTKHFWKQVEEERKHHKIIFDYITEQGALIATGGTPQPEFNYAPLESDPSIIKTLMKKYQDLEKKTTADISRIFKKAALDGDEPTMLVMTELLGEQKKEEPEAADMVRKAGKTNSFDSIKAWDTELQKEK